jgi:uncharacterized phiE125 gp8 family phage protein
MLSLVTPPAIEPFTVAEARRHLKLGQTAGEPAPPAPTVALVSPATPGLCDAGAWRFGFTFVTPDGETQLGDLSDPVNVADPAINGKIQASNVAIGGSSCTARRAYAVPPAGGVPRLAATIADNVSDTLVINIAAAALGVQAPTVNTTIDPQLSQLVMFTRERCEMSTGRALIMQTWDLVLNSFPSEGYIEIPRPPLISVSYVKYLDRAGQIQTMDPATDYITQAPVGPRCSHGRIALPFAHIWPITLPQMGAITLRFVAGYGTSAALVPAMLQYGMKLDLGGLFANPENVLLNMRAPQELPNGTRAIYVSYRALPTQRGIAAA